jgi:hypothetical protein
LKTKTYGFSGEKVRCPRKEKTRQDLYMPGSRTFGDHPEGTKIHPQKQRLYSGKFLKKSWSFPKMEGSS